VKFVCEFLIPKQSVVSWSKTEFFLLIGKEYKIQESSEWCSGQSKVSCCYVSWKNCCLWCLNSWRSPDCHYMLSLSRSKSKSCCTGKPLV